MKARTTRIKGRPPEIVFKDGKAKAVILDIEKYRQILERLEDLEDLKTLEEMRRKPLKFRKLDDLLKEHHTGV